MTVLAALLKFFLDTRLGQSLVLAGALSLAVWGTYHVIDARADARGYTRAHAECLAGQAKAQAAQQQAERKATQAAETIADNIRNAAITSRAQNATQTAQAVQRVRHEQTVTIGCAVSDRVRDEGRAAVERARRASGRL